MPHGGSEYLLAHHCKVDANQQGLFSKLCFPHVIHTIAVIRSVTSQNTIKIIYYFKTGFTVMDFMFYGNIKLTY